MGLQESYMKNVWFILALFSKILITSSLTCYKCKNYSGSCPKGAKLKKVVCRKNRVCVSYTDYDNLMESRIYHYYGCGWNRPDKCTGNHFLKLCDRHCYTDLCNTVYHDDVPLPPKTTSVTTTKKIPKITST